MAMWWWWETSTCPALTGKGTEQVILEMRVLSTWWKTNSGFSMSLTMATLWIYVSPAKKKQWQELRFWNFLAMRTTTCLRLNWQGHWRTMTPWRKFQIGQLKVEIEKIDWEKEFEEMSGNPWTGS